MPRDELSSVRLKREEKMPHSDIYVLVIEDQVARRASAECQRFMAMVKRADVKSAFSTKAAWLSRIATNVRISPAGEETAEILTWVRKRTNYRFQSTSYILSSTYAFSHRRYRSQNRVRRTYPVEFFWEGSHESDKISIFGALCRQYGTNRELACVAKAAFSSPSKRRSRISEAAFCAVCATVPHLIPSTPGFQHPEFDSRVSTSRKLSRNLAFALQRIIFSNLFLPYAHFSFSCSTCTGMIEAKTDPSRNSGRRPLKNRSRSGRRRGQLGEKFRVPHRGAQGISAPPKIWPGYKKYTFGC